MKIVRYQGAGKQAGGPLVGYVQGDCVLPLPDVADAQALIALWGRGELPAAPSGEGVPLSQVRLLAPIVPQRNVMCVGWNYLKHFNESKGKREGQEVELPERPTFFTKLNTAVTGPHDTLPLHEAHTAKLDWEVELAVVIGKAGATSARKMRCPAYSAI